MPDLEVVVVFVVFAVELIEIDVIFGNTMGISVIIAVVLTWLVVWLVVVVVESTELY